MDPKPVIKDRTLQFLESFLCAGSSALLLSLAHLHPGYWFVSLFALLPFLWRLNKTGLSGSLVLGMILAGSYACVVSTGEILLSPWSFLVRLLLLISVFSIFAVTVNGLRRRIGFNPIFVAALWLPFEYVLTRYSGLGSIFAFSDCNSGFLIAFGSLFGFLSVSFGIVLINSAILMLVEYVGEKVPARGACGGVKVKTIRTSFKKITIVRGCYHLPELRAPPGIAQS